jgi:hypothetical protein
MNPLALSIDNAQPTPQDDKDIREGYCLHCYQKYNFICEIMFVRLVNGNLIWWHTSSCVLNKKK